MTKKKSYNDHSTSCVQVYAVDHIVAPRRSNNTRKICIWICAWNNYVLYTLVCVHFIVFSMYVSPCSTPLFSSPSFSSPANSAIPDVNAMLCIRLSLLWLAYVGGYFTAWWRNWEKENVITFNTETATWQVRFEPKSGIISLRGGSINLR